eukprot:COSAG02_NODE_5504_length_4276_cov_4.553986_4_plen_45_part_00
MRSATYGIADGRATYTTTNNSGSANPDAEGALWAQLADGWRPDW